ncbi:MAG: DNA polymerase III subunit [Candidatus Omnitrophica bacterium]|nr:DNA polymerase III subunit [Candidatus Omnitrophota bacterium]
MKKSSNSYLNELIPGQAAVFERLLSMKETGALGQSFIFVGGAGWGKYALSRAFARMLLCGNGTFPGFCECSSCRRVQSGQHPDFRYFGGDESKRSIAIAEIRSLLEWMGFKSFEGKAKIAVLKGSERLTQEAGNALLKLLEEPPVSSYLILLAENPKRLLETIRSRCSFIRLRPPSLAEAGKQLENGGISRERALYLARKSGGNFAVAMELSEANDEKEIREFLRKVSLGSAQPLIALWQKLERAEIVKNIRNTQQIFRDALVLAVGGSEDQVLFQESRNELSSLGREGIPRLLRKLGYLLEADRALRSNANQKLVLTRLEMMWDQ